MNGFEMHTATLLVGLLYLALPTFTWVVLGAGRNRAAALWCIGGLAMGMATVLISGFSGTQFISLSLSLPVFLYTASFIATNQALRMDLGKPYSTRTLLLALLGSTVIFEILLRGLGLYVPRAIYVSLIFAVGLVCLMLHARQIGIVEKSQATRWIALAYFGATLAIVFRIIYLSRQDLSTIEGYVVSEGPASVAVAVMMMLASVIGHFGYVGLVLERTQRQAIEIAMEQARLEVSQQLGDQIAVLERRQSLGELTASIGHELNQPLTAVLTNTQLAMRGLQAGRITTEIALELLGKIEYNTQRASRILERIRDLMRSRESRQEVVDLHKIIQDVVELLEGDVRVRGVHIEIGLVQGPVVVRGDPLQLSQVLLNLMRNAIDSLALQQERRIRIECQQREDRAILAVRDWGRGLSPAQQEQVGAPFFSTKPQGLGMGLAISRTIARNHRGTLTVSNAQDGKGPGALAVLDLPLLPQETET